jgi:hypothetical protein
MFMFLFSFLSFKVAIQGCSVSGYGWSELSFSFWFFFWLLLVSLACADTPLCFCYFKDYILLPKIRSLPLSFWSVAMVKGECEYVLLTCDIRRILFHGKVTLAIRYKA